MRAATEGVLGSRGIFRRKFHLFVLIPVLFVWLLIQFLLYQKPSQERGSNRLLRAHQDEFFAFFGRENATSEPSALGSDCPTCESCGCDSDNDPIPVPYPTVVPPAPPPPSYSKKDRTELEWGYLLNEKAWPYVGSPEWNGLFPVGSRKYYNSMAVFPHGSETRKHGLVGLFANGSRWWIPDPMPPPIHQLPGGKDEGLKNGGFYLNLSDALPLDRDPVDGRDSICLDEEFDYQKLPDVTIIITFYNEALSTLLRSVHSVLNYTPAPLLTEIVLVDDHGDLPDNVAGGRLDDYVKLLPKTKILRLPERRGLVWARLAGAEMAKAPVVVVLDSHIEVNKGWLEPQLARLVESPRSIVFPQIMAIHSEDFSYLNQQGIGCFLTFKWAMQEKASLTGKITTTAPIASPSMAGGLFAVYRDWFWELGGYDEEFSMWGAENVEMGFRTWMCGGRMECTPCARVYHIYRKGGHAYTSPSEALWKNRLRTARIWTDEFFQLAEKFNHHPGFDIGPLDKMIALKERLQCRDFKWFLQNVDPNHELRVLEDITVMGEFKSKGHRNLCIDTMGHSKAGEEWAYFGCHGSGGTQGYLMTRLSGHIRTFQDEYRCLGKDFKLTDCHNDGKDGYWSIPDDGTIRWKDSECLTVVEGGTEVKLDLLPCNPQSPMQEWHHTRFKPDPDFQLPQFSDEYLARKTQEERERREWAAGRIPQSFIQEEEEVEELPANDKVVIQRDRDAIVNEQIEADLKVQRREREAAQERNDAPEQDIPADEEVAVEANLERQERQKRPAYPGVVDPWAPPKTLALMEEKSPKVVAVIEKNPIIEQEEVDVVVGEEQEEQ